MAFDAQRRAFAVSETPWLNLEAARNLAGGMQFDLLDTDLTGEDIGIFLSVAPGRVASGPMDVNVDVVNVTTWDAVVTPGNLQHLLPSDAQLTDAVTVSSITIDFNPAVLDTFPDSTEEDGILTLYHEIRRKDGTGDRIAGGVFYLTESNLNGDP